VIISQIKAGGKGMHSS